MRKLLKILHTLAACGLIGGLFVYMVLLVEAPQESPAAYAYADLRVSIAVLSNYVLLPSLALALVSGVLSMVVHTPFLRTRWAWVKAVSGILMFKGVLTIIGAKADYAAIAAEQIAEGKASAALLESALAYEWITLWAIMGLSVANVVLGVWRPRLKSSVPQTPDTAAAWTRAPRAVGPRGDARRFSFDGSKDR